LLELSLGEFWRHYLEIETPLLISQSIMLWNRWVMFWSGKSSCCACWCEDLQKCSSFSPSKILFHAEKFLML